MTKKQLEKYRKEFDEFIANAEKLGARFLTEDELRYKINGGTDDFASDQTEATADGGDSYTVQSGDTLSEIVEDYNSEHGTDYTYQEIAEQNGIENPDLIYPWDEINFGGGNTKTETAEDEDVSGTKTQDADNLDENNDTTSEDEEATNEKSDVAEQKDETQTEKTSDDGKTSSGRDMTVDSKNLSYDSATGTFRSNPTLSDVKISPAKPEDNLAAAMEAANGKSKETVNQDVMDFGSVDKEKSDGFFSNLFNSIMSRVQIDTSDNLYRGYIFPDSGNIGLGCGGYGESFRTDTSSNHLMSFPLSDDGKEGFHVDSVYFGGKICF